MSRVRADVLLVSRGLAESRAQAQALIMAGLVGLPGGPVRKAGQLLPPESALAVAARPRFVSRGGEKLDAALMRFGLEPCGLVCLDVGASTGGFTDCLLQHGAAKVYAVDAGYGQLADSLRRDPRVVSMERVNARFLESLPEPPEFAVIDVSFIGLEKVLPSLARLLAPGSPVVALVKPQFQGERGEVGRGGVVKDPEIHARIVGRLVAWLVRNGFGIHGLMRSPLEGGDGNREFLTCLQVNRA